MKPNIHPKMNDLVLEIGSDSITTKSVLSGKLVVDQDYRTHRAWLKEAVTTANQSNKNVSVFKNRYSGLNFDLKKKP